MKTILRLFFILALFLSVPGWVLAQTGPEPTDETPTEEPAADLTEDEQRAQQNAERVTTLLNMQETIDGIRANITELERDRERARTDEQKAAITEEIETRTQSITDLNNDFAVLATGIDRESFFENARENFDWEEELEAILAPVFVELKDATARPRELEMLRSQIAVYEKKLPQVGDALESLTALRDADSENGVDGHLEELADFWQQQQDQLQGQHDAAAQRLKELESEEVDLGAATGEILRLFFRERGANLLFAFLAFLGIFMGLRYLHRVIQKHFAKTGKGSQTRQMLFRLVDVGYYVLTMVLAIGALLVVLYLSADWVLLTVAVLVLIGLAWAARNAVPAFLEQGKLLLNVGSVREGERLIYNGIPWRVETLSFFCELENPALRSGSLRVPLRDIVNLCSRPAAEDERWFPSEIGDWVIVGDGTYGEVVEQTPEVVVVATTRGIHRTYPSVDYMAQHPKNLSVNFFAVPRVVGLDYRYRDIVNTEIVTKLKAAIEAGFRETPYGEHLNRVIVELKELGDSSLNVITIGRFAGPAASEYTEIGWKIQQLALECCNENGWEIPFPQLTVHRAELDGATADS